MPCNTDGGLLSNSHNGDPHGMQTIEVVRQLRGECGGPAGAERQDRAVPGPGRFRPRVRRDAHHGRGLRRSDARPAPPYLKPLPEISDLNRPFWEGLDLHEFLVANCADCGDYNWVPYPACRTCQSENQQWTVVSGDATVFSFTVVYRGHGAFDDDVPYAMALGKLAEQPRACIVLGNRVGIPNEDLHIGMPVKMRLRGHSQ